MRQFVFLCCTLPLALAAAPAWARAEAGQSCVQSLSPDALKIYQAARPDMRPDTDMAALLRAKVMPMVLNGDMTRLTARQAATAASICLRAALPPVELADRTQAR